MKNNIAAALLILLLISLYFNFKSNLWYSSLKKEESISFEQKQKCATYKKDIEAKFEKENKVTYLDREIIKSLERVFYSEKSSSCLALYKENWYKINTNDMYYEYVLKDILTGEIISKKAIFRNEIGDKNMLDFYQLLKEYEFGVSSTSK